LPSEQPGQIGYSLHVGTVVVGTACIGYSDWVCVYLVVGRCTLTGRIRVGWGISIWYKVSKIEGGVAVMLILCENCWLRESVQR